MSYKLLKSPHFEKLLDRYHDLFLQKDLLDSDTLIIVQNQQTSRWLSHKLSEKNTILMGFETFLTEEGFRRLALDFDCVKNVLPSQEDMRNAFLFDDDLRLLIYHQMRTHLDHPQLEFVHNYLEKIPSSLQETRLWDLAREISGWFSQYARSSAALMRMWRHNNAMDILGEKESWQRFLWYEIFGGDVPSYHILGDWLDRIQEKKATYEGKIKRIILVGSAFLNQVYLDFLQYISDDIEIFHFLLQPVCDAHPNLEWPFLISHTVMYDQLTHYFASHACAQEIVTGSSAASCALQALQASIYSGIPYNPPVSADESLLQIMCADRQREVEVLKDMILAAADKDPHLNLNEIAILAPNINDYAAYIQAVFERGEKNQQIPYNIIDLEERENPSFALACASLMEIASGRFSRKDIFTLLENPLLIARYQITEEELKIWLNFCEKTAILLAKDQKHKQELSLGDSDKNTFDAAFKRLLIGKIMGPWELKDFQSLYDASGNTMQIIEKFITIIERIYQDFTPLTKMKLCFEEWLDKIEKPLEEHLVAPYEEMYSLRKVFQHLRESATKIHAQEYGQQILSFSVIKEIFLQVVDSGKRKVGRYLMQGIVCSSLIPMRALPFKIIAILGLGNGEFPAPVSTKNPGYDLLEHPYLKEKIHIHAHKNYLDRHAFLETIFSTTQALWFFYQDRHHSTGEAISACSSLSDLQQLLSAQVMTKESLLTMQYRYPKLPFSPLIYQNDSPYVSYDHRWFSMAKAMLKPKQTLQAPDLHDDTHAMQEANPLETLCLQSIDVKELGLFIKNPAGYFRKKILPTTSQVYAQDKAKITQQSYDIPRYERIALYQKLIEYHVSHTHSSWHTLLKQDIQRYLKNGLIGEQVLSSYALASLEDELSWLSAEIEKLKLSELLSGCRVHTQSMDDTTFEAPVLQIGTHSIYVYGLLENVFLDQQAQSFYALGTVTKEDYAYSMQCQFYLCEILCKMIAPDYTFESYIFTFDKRKTLRGKKRNISQEDATILMHEIVESWIYAHTDIPHIDTMTFGGASKQKSMMEETVLRSYEQNLYKKVYQEVGKNIDK